MRVIMTTQISGTRGDEKWPAPGETPFDIGDDEAFKLISMGVAVKDPDQSKPAAPADEKKVAWPPPAETAVVPENDVEVRHEQPGAVESDRAKENTPAATESPLTQVAPRRGPGRPRKDSLPS